MKITRRQMREMILEQLGKAAKDTPGAGARITAQQSGEIHISAVNRLIFGDILNPKQKMKVIDVILDEIVQRDIYSKKEIDGLREIMKSAIRKNKKNIFKKIFGK